MTSDGLPLNVGQRLREARERRGIALRTIAEQTKISVRTLEALERNDIQALPGGIFARGFMRSYAVAVGLDPEQTILDFIAQFPEDSVTQGHPHTRTIMDDDAETRRDAIRLGVWLLAVLVPIVVGGLYMACARPTGRAVPSTTAAPARSR